MGDYKKLVLDGNSGVGNDAGFGSPAEDQWFNDLVELRNGRRITDMEYRAAYAAGNKAATGITDVMAANIAAGTAIAKLLPPTVLGTRGRKTVGS